MRKTGHRNGNLRLSIFAILIVEMDNSEYAQIRPRNQKSAPKLDRRVGIRLVDVFLRLKCIHKALWRKPDYKSRILR